MAGARYGQMSGGSSRWGFGDDDAYRAMPGQAHPSRTIGFFRMLGTMGLSSVVFLALIIGLEKFAPSESWRPSVMLGSFGASVASTSLDGTRKEQALTTAAQTDAQQQATADAQIDVAEVKERLDARLDKTRRANELTLRAYDAAFAILKDQNNAYFTMETDLARTQTNAADALTLGKKIPSIVGDGVCSSWYIFGNGSLDTEICKRSAKVGERAMDQGATLARRNRSAEFDTRIRALPTPEALRAQSDDMLSADAEAEREAERDREADRRERDRKDREKLLTPAGQ